MSVGPKLKPYWNKFGCLGTWHGATVLSRMLRKAYPDPFPPRLEPKALIPKRKDDRLWPACGPLEPRLETLCGDASGLAVENGKCHISHNLNSL